MEAFDKKAQTYLKGLGIPVDSPQVIVGTVTAPKKKDEETNLTPEILEAMALNTIAWTIRQDWKNVNYAAAPYLQAMQSLCGVSDSYGQDDGRSVVLYFLGNASSWRGPVAKAVKAELKRRLGVK